MNNYINKWFAFVWRMFQLQIIKNKNFKNKFHIHNTNHSHYNYQNIFNSSISIYVLLYIMNWFIEVVVITKKKKKKKTTEGKEINKKIYILELQMVEVRFAERKHGALKWVWEMNELMVGNRRTSHWHDLQWGKIPLKLWLQSTISTKKRQQNIQPMDNNTLKSKISEVASLFFIFLIGTNIFIRIEPKQKKVQTMPTWGIKGATNWSTYGRERAGI